MTESMRDQYPNVDWADVDGDECAHLSVTDATGYPYDRAGYCVVYAVCEDCGKELGRIGTGSVL